MLRTAINLKNAIDMVPKKIESIGTCYTMERDWKVDHMGEDESDDNQINKLVEELDDRINDISDSYKSGQFDEGQLEKWNLKVNVKNISYDGSLSKLSMDVIEKLYEHAPAATFGNMKEMKTEIDPNVRSARDLTAADHFQVNDQMCLEIAKCWKKKFNYSGKVRAEAYKINLYGKGDKFKEHRDTPSKNLLGTFLIGLGDTSNKSSNLIVRKMRSVYSWDYNQWERTKLGSWCSFYPDMRHEVTEVTSGIRANLSFKIFADKDSDKEETELSEYGKFIRGLDRKYMNNWKKIIKDGFSDIGIILSHDYSLNADQLKGLDRFYYEFFRKLGLNIYIMPVLINFESYTDYEDNRCSSAVYPLTDDHLEHIMLPEKNSCPVNKFHDVTFFRNPKGYTWYTDETPYCEYTGNECQPGEEDSLYLHRVMILRPSLKTKTAEESKEESISSETTSSSGDVSVKSVDSEEEQENSSEKNSEESESKSESEDEISSSSSFISQL